MTTPTTSGTGPHLSPDTLADLSEELLDARAAATARAHLATCPLCAEDYALIAEAAALFDTLPPDPIPLEVVSRVEAALHREPALTPATAARGTRPDCGAHHAGRRPARLRLRLLFASMAGAAAVVAATVFGVSALSNSGSADKASSTAAGGLNSPGGPAAAEGAGGPGLAAVQQQATQLLARLYHGTMPNSAVEPQKSEAAARCWKDPKPGTHPLAEAATTYDGQMAELLVYAHPGDSTKADVYVVPAAPQCGSGTAGEPLATTEIAVP